MGPISAILGGGGIIGSAIAQNKTNRQNRIYADKEINLSLAAHQNEVADLRAAGLNPMLSGLGGSGAAVPNTNAHQQAEFQASDMNALIATAQEKERIDKEIKAVDSQIKLNEEAEKTQKTQQQNNIANSFKAQEDGKLSQRLAGKAVADTYLSGVTAQRQSAETSLVQQQELLKKLEELVARAQLPGKELEGKKSKMQGTVDTNPLIFAIENIKKLLNPLDVYKAIPKK